MRLRIPPKRIGANRDAKRRLAGSYGTGDHPSRIATFGSDLFVHERLRLPKKTGTLLCRLEKGGLKHFIKLSQPFNFVGRFPWPRA